MLDKLKSDIKKFCSILREKIKKFLDSPKVNDILDLVKFIVIHGFMGLFILLCIVSLGNIDFIITKAIRNSYLWTSVIFFMGSGSFYYIFIDVVDVLRKKGIKR